MKFVISGEDERRHVAYHDEVDSVNIFLFFTKHLPRRMTLAHCHVSEIKPNHRAFNLGQAADSSGCQAHLYDLP